MGLVPSYAHEGIVSVLEGSPSSLSVALGGTALDAGNRTGFYSTLTGTERLGFVVGGTHVGYFDNDLVDAALSVLGPIVSSKNLNIGDIDGGHTPAAGDIRFASAKFEGYTGSAWVDFAISTPAGADTQVQFNNAGVLGANANFTYTIGTGVEISDATASTTTATGALVVTGGVGIGGDVYTGGNIDVVPTGSNVEILLQPGTNDGTTRSRVSIKDPLGPTLTLAAYGSLWAGTKWGLGLASNQEVGATNDLFISAAGDDIRMGGGSSQVLQVHDDALLTNRYVQVNGKLTVTGLIDPTGLELTTQASNPGGTPAETLWLRTSDGHLMRGAVDVESAAAAGGSDTHVQFNNSGSLAGNANFTYTIGTGVAVGDATASTTTATGALVVTGGAGIGGAVNIGGVLKTFDTTDATFTSLVGPLGGSLVADGGASILKKLYVGDTIATDAVVQAGSYLEAGSYPWIGSPATSYSRLNPTGLAFSNTSGPAYSATIGVNGTFITMAASVAIGEHTQFNKKVNLAGLLNSTLQDGDVWYDSGATQFRFRENGVTKSLGTQTNVDDGNATGDLLYWNGSKWTYATSSLLNWNNGTAYLTIDGIVKPDGVEFVAVATNPGTVAAQTLWVNSGDSNKLYYGASEVGSGGGGGTPGGADTQIQYNNAGAFGGSANFTYDGSTVAVGLATASTSPSTGAFTVTGGVGIGDDLYVGDDCNIQGNLKLDGLFQGNMVRVNTSTTLTRDVTHVNQYGSGITTAVWASPSDGDVVKIANTSAGTTTVSGNGNTIGGSATITLQAGDTVELVWDNTGSDWIIY